jgi:type VI protein secretion system component VasF
LATDAAAGLAPPMKTTTRRSLRRAWRVPTWPLAAHIVFALGTGFACAVVATNYPQVMAPRYAAVFGVVVLYPAMVTV